MKNEKISDNNKRTWKNPETRAKRIAGMSQTAYGGSKENKFKQIKPLLYNGLSCNQISKSEGINLSYPTIKKLILEFGSQEDIRIMEENKSRGKATAGKACKGKKSKLKGKTYEQILGSKEAAEIRKKASSDWMKQNNWSPRKFTKKISKPQQELFDIIKEKYPSAELEFPIKRKDHCNISLDIAIPELKINIEYDGMYWHDKNNVKNVNKSAMTDSQRDEFLKSKGWRVFRFQYSKTPSRKMLVEQTKKYGII